MRRNVPMFGFVLGVLMPVVGFFIVYAILFHSYTFGDFTAYLMRTHEKAATVISLAILLNVLPFIYFTNKRLDLSARGVLIATILYAVLIILLRFVWN
ncbi:MAG: hypothetical protein JST70_05665 [Bacteroidetes bacterium]|nr:hypothetical protein [Bacteroidota bacterium]